MIDDKTISFLLSCRKHYKGKKLRPDVQKGSKRWNLELYSDDGRCFTMYVRQNMKNEDAFSCGLSTEFEGNTVTLARYNGCCHEHTNSIEKNELDFVCHIHSATEKYAKAGLKIDGFAQETDRYTTLIGAIRCMINDCEIVGISESSFVSVGCLEI